LHLRPAHRAESLLDLLLHLGDVGAARRANEDDVREPLLPRQLLQLCERDVDVRGLTAEGRTHESDDLEHRSVQVERRAELQGLAFCVRGRDERLTSTAFVEEAAGVTTATA